MLNRRELLLGLSTAAALAKPVATRPSLLIVLAEDVPAWVLGSYGNKEFQTPNLDRFALGGVRFPFSFAASSIAGENRRVLLSVVDVLTRAGYQVDAAPGQPEMAASFTSVTDKAVAFLNQQTAERPFACVVSYPACSAVQGIDAKYAALYTQTRFDHVGSEPASPTAAEGKDRLQNIESSLRNYAAALTGLDAQLPVLQRALYDHKLVDSTAIVFTSAGGHLLGRHGLWGQGNASRPVNWYEESVAIPLLWNWPGRVPADVYRPELIGAQDLSPTVHEMVGIPYTGAGRSYLTLLENRRLPKKEPWRELVVGRSADSAMARDTHYKLVLRDGGKTPGELYDVKSDAGEKNNQYSNPAYTTVRQTLTKALS